MLSDKRLKLPVIRQIYAGHCLLSNTNIQACVVTTTVVYEQALKQDLQTARRKYPPIWQSHAPSPLGTFILCGKYIAPGVPVMSKKQNGCH